MNNATFGVKLKMIKKSNKYNTQLFLAKRERKDILRATHISKQGKVGSGISQLRIHVSFSDYLGGNIQSKIFHVIPVPTFLLVVSPSYVFAGLPNVKVTNWKAT